MIFRLFSGQRTVIELAPGEMFQINCYRPNSSHANNTDGNNVGSVHWNAAVNFGWNVGTSYFRIDGDTPTGTEMIVYSNMLNVTHQTGKYNGYNTFFTWANAGYNYGSLSETHSYGTFVLNTAPTSS